LFTYYLVVEDPSDCTMLFPGHTRTSLLRTLNSQGNFDPEEWLLPETRQLFETQASRQKRLAQGMALTTPQWHLCAPIYIATHKYRIELHCVLSYKQFATISAQGQADETLLVEVYRYKHESRKLVDQIPSDLNNRACTNCILV